MELINKEEQEDGAVSLEFGRDEFHTLRNALNIATDALERETDKHEMLIDQLEGVS